MSPREKKLLIFFAAAGFIVLNFLAYAQFQAKRLEFDRALGEARQQLDTAEMFRASREQVTDEMEWLAAHDPEPAANQDVQTQLQQLCEREAKGLGLEIKAQRPLPTDAPSGAHYHRAKIQLTVSGSEDALYRWFDKLNVPDQLRAASQIRLSPNTKDDTKIDCTATVEQWFVPLPTT
ncbi:MAG: hypothetical protein ACO3JG_02705 [Luteolibacter sp.]